MPGRSTGLGRGIYALLPRGVQQVLELPRDVIRPNRLQPRERVDEGGLRELADSIRLYGILQPVVVAERDDDGMYELIAGERRWRAAGMAGLTVVPGLVRSVGEQERLQLALVENLQRVNLSPVERARAFRRLQAEFDLTQEGIAETVGKSRSAVANTMRLLDLPEDALRALSEGRITEGHARAILGVRDPLGRSELLEGILRDGMSVRVVERVVRRRNDRVSRRSGDDVERRWLESALRDSLQTKVEVQRTGKGGRIVVHFYGDEDLQVLFERMTGCGDVPRETASDGQGRTEVRGA